MVYKPITVKLKGILMLCEKEMEQATIAAEDRIEELKIKYTLDELVNNFKKIYHYINFDKNILRIQGNISIERELEPGKRRQKKVQIYNLKVLDQYDMEFDTFQLKYRFVIELCIAIEQLKLFKSLREEEDKKSEITNILYDVKLRNFLKQKK